MDESPTARALLALELLQARPGISAQALGDRLGVSERAARRYVAILREAGVPVESVRGPYGGYRIGRGLRMPPLMFTATEALALAMAVIESHGRTDDAEGDESPVATALGKIVRVLPEQVARPVEAVRQVSARRTDPDPPDPATTAALVQAGDDGHRIRIDYRGREHDVDPWAVVVRHGRWYLVGFSHTVGARRLYRVDRVASIRSLPESCAAPADLDPLREVEEQLAEGWRYRCEVEVEAPLAEVREWLPRALGRLEAIDEHRTRLVGTTQALHWYAGNLTALNAPFRVLGGPELHAEVARLGDLLGAAVRPGPGSPAPAR